MSSKSTLQSVPALPQQADSYTDSPYLTLEEGARYARFDATAVHPVRAFQKWLSKANVPVCRRGRVLLVERRVLDAYLRGETWAKRRSA